MPPLARTETTPKLSRRTVVAGVTAVVLTRSVWPAAAAAFEDDGNATAAMEHIAAGRKINPGRVKLVMPELAENGNVVALAVDVESAMTANDYVKTIHIIAGQNPLAIIARYHLGPRSGRARVQSTIRLATTQSVTALAEMSDGTLWSGTMSVLVTLSACLDGG
jgi:sulfur-oxidizing protein SoxY